MIFAFREAQQVQSTAQAVAWGAAAKASKDELTKTCKSTKEAVARLGQPTLLEYLKTRDLDPGIRSCLEKISELQRSALAEIEAVQAMVESDGGREEVMAFLAAEKQCSALKQEVALQINQLAAAEAGQNRAGDPRTATAHGNAGQAARPAKGRGGECPLGWQQLLQLTGEEGPTAKYQRDADGKLQRAEAFYGGSVIVAVTKVDGGFRITLGNDLAIADFTSRPWFSAEERDALIEAYGQYAAKVPGSTDEKTIGRFRVLIEQDPQLPIRPSFVLWGAE